MTNEKRLIDANDLQRKLLGLADLYNVGYLFFDVVNDEIDNATSVDATEVVRCKDCIYSTAKDGDLYCDGPIGIFGSVGFNDFCSCGERKKDGDL